MWCLDELRREALVERLLGVRVRCCTAAKHPGTRLDAAPLRYAPGAKRSGN